MPRRSRLARALLRLYPRSWRTRYQDEVLALVEEAGLGTRQAIDLALGAVTTGAFGTSSGVTMMVVAGGAVLLAGVVSSLGTVVALRLAERATAPPTLYWIALIVFAAAMPRLAVTFGATAFAGWPWLNRSIRIGRGEFVGWVIVIWFAAACIQWGNLTEHLGTGLSAELVSSVWQTSSIQVLIAFLMLLIGSRWFLDAADRQRALRVARLSIARGRVLGL